MLIYIISIDEVTAIQDINAVRYVSQQFCLVFADGLAA